MDKLPAFKDQDKPSQCLIDFRQLILDQNSAKAKSSWSQASYQNNSNLCMAHDFTENVN